MQLRKHHYCLLLAKWIKGGALIILRLDTLKVLLQTVQTQMKSPTMWHFNCVCTIKIELQRRLYNMCLEIAACDPSKYTIDHIKLYGKV